MTIYDTTLENVNLSVESSYYYPNSNIPNVTETDIVVLNYSIINASYFKTDNAYLNFEVNNTIVQDVGVQCYYMANYTYPPSK